MSLITSCPACRTMFRVVPDQLKISEGWVRCGHCGEVFDATAFLTDESAIELVRGEEATRPASLASGPGELATRPADLGDFATRPADLGSIPAELGRSTDQPPARTSPPGPPPSTLAQEAPQDEDVSSSYFGTESQSLQPSPLDAPFVFRHSDMVPEGESSVLPPAPDSSFAASQPPEPAPPKTPKPPKLQRVEEVSFVRQARRKAFWRRPLVRVVLAFVSLALAAGLLLQLAYEDRDRLALAEPQLRPALERMCELMQCTLGAPRQIESVVIESSGFNRVRNDTYRLSFTLRNAANVPVAVPSMELTLTDVQDQPVARRVLTPAELGAANDMLPAAGDWSGTVGLVLTLPSASRVAGYRLLAFYP
jgi:predicted Zn finger-like uncharacterized protein